MRKQEPNEVQDLYESGIRAIQAVTASFEPEDWDVQACGNWDCADTARHLLGVVGWYHDWLDRALAGETHSPFPPSEFDQRNQADIDCHQNLTGPEAIDAFAVQAEHYLTQAVPEWDRPYGFPLGTVTVGLHVGVAATEWHVHAWDLSVNNPQRHTPAKPEQLFIAAGSAMSVAKGGVGGSALGLLVPLVSKRSPWSTLLKRSGR